MAILPFERKTVIEEETETVKITFADFWTAYPRKQAKVDAEKAWRQIGGDQFPYMIEAIQRSRLTDDWRRNNGQFIPLPASYLRGKRFDDELEGDGEFEAPALRILGFLNGKAARSYQPVDENLSFIVARLKDGATEQELRQVIAKKCREWKGDARMENYLRPATLFDKQKFAQYRGELVNG